MNQMITVAILLLRASWSHAQDPIDASVPPSSLPTSLARPSFQETQRPSTMPTNAPVFTSSPSDSECANNPNWYFEFWDYSLCVSGKKLKLGCDDDRVGCWDYGNLGSATYSCCKCKSQCLAQCNDPIRTTDDGMCGSGSENFYYADDDNYNDDDEFSFTSVLGGIGFFVIVCAAIALCRCNDARQQQARLEANRQTMSTRRRQQRQNNSQGLTEEERNHARYALFVSKFYFQTVLPGQSNISASSLRSSAAKPDEEHPKGDHDDASIVGEKPTKHSLSTRRLSSWRRPSAKDECCICLESYDVGETICAAITPKCKHCFHDACILNWVKNNDKCPLCRVDLLKD